MYTKLKYEFTRLMVEAKVIDKFNNLEMKLASRKYPQIGGSWVVGGR